MRKSYKFKKKIVPKKNFRYNFQIKALEVSVIDEQGVNVGLMKTRDAIALAEERGFDLVEVSPMTNPPVAKLMNFGSFQYQKEKLLKKQKKQSKSLDVKSVRLSIKIGEHDKETKMKQAKKFLEKGHKIKIELILRGREMRYLDLGRQTINKFKEDLNYPVIIEQDVSKQGNKLFLILIPENTNAKE